MPKRNNIHKNIYKIVNNVDKKYMPIIDLNNFDLEEVWKFLDLLNSKLKEEYKKNYSNWNDHDMKNFLSYLKIHSDKLGFGVMVLDAEFSVDDKEIRVDYLFWNFQKKDNPGQDILIKAYNKK